MILDPSLTRAREWEAKKSRAQLTGSHFVRNPCGVNRARDSRCYVSSTTGLPSSFGGFRAKSPAIHRKLPKAEIGDVVGQRLPNDLNRQRFASSAKAPFPASISVSGSFLL